MVQIGSSETVIQSLGLDPRQEVIMRTSLLRSSCFGIQDFETIWRVGSVNLVTLVFYHPPKDHFRTDTHTHTV